MEVGKDRPHRSPLNRLKLPYILMHHLYALTMRTTVRLDDQLLKAAKRYAHETGLTLTAVIENALRQALSTCPTQIRRPRTRLTTVKGNGLRPGIDLDDSAALLAVMDETRGPA